MGTFKLQVPARLMLTQILDGATLGRRRLLAWNARSPRLPMPLPNVIRADRRFEARARDSQIVLEFKSKLRQTEDLINKLGFSLREIYNDEN